MQIHTFLTSDRPTLGLGLAALGRPGYINLGHGQDLGQNYAVPAMAQQAQAVLDAAWACGIRYFDVARSYGRAEEFLGNWLRTRTIPSQVVSIGSKWGYTYTADWQVTADKHEVKDHTLPVLQRQWQESQRHLDGYLDLYQIHSATLDSGVLTNQGVLTELLALKQRGVAIGLSLSGPQQATTLAQALSIVVDGVRLFDAVQATWNLLEQAATATLQQAHELGLVVIVKEALANGRLTPRNAEPAFGAQLALLQREAARLQTTIDALALAAVLAQPWVTIVLSGATTTAQLSSNLKAIDVQFDEEVTAALHPLVETPAVYWATRSALSWN